jgi:hypothetical protein
MVMMMMVVVGLLLGLLLPMGLGAVAVAIAVALARLSEIVMVFKPRIQSTEVFADTIAQSASVNAVLIPLLLSLLTLVSLSSCIDVSRSGPMYGVVQ